MKQRNAEPLNLLHRYCVHLDALLTSITGQSAINMDNYDAAVDPTHTLDLGTPTPAGPFSQHHQQEYVVASDAGQQQPADFVTDPLKQLLLTDMSVFFQTEVAPRSAAINEVSSGSGTGLCCACCTSSSASRSRTPSKTSSTGHPWQLQQSWETCMAFLY